MGEKQRWGKRSLWNDGTRVPFIVDAPGHFDEQTCDRPVGLIDLFPTLLALTNLRPTRPLEGQSLEPWLQDPEHPETRPVLTTFGPGNHALTSTQWRYIRYADGSEELYDRQNDPNEWVNLNEASEHQQLLTELRDKLPQTEAPPLIGTWKQWEIQAWEEANLEAGVE